MLFLLLLLLLLLFAIVDYFLLSLDNCCLYLLQFPDVFIDLCILANLAVLMSVTATGVVDSISHTKLDQDSMIHTRTGKDVHVFVFDKCFAQMPSIHSFIHSFISFHFHMEGDYIS